MGDVSSEDEKPFPVVLKRPGDRYGTAVATGEPGYAVGGYDILQGDWAVFLPHSCDEWVIATGDRGRVLAEVLRFRAELDLAVETLREAAP